MGMSSLQVCMDSSDWFQGTIPHHEEDNSTQLLGMLQGDSTSSSPMSSSCMTPPSAAGEDSGAGILAAACNRPGGLIERRLRPQHEQALKCPRCDSTHTKFCYYNNYSLSQPRYFCKTCRRYWTKGGTLRNIPVGGGCRKNTKKPSSSSSSANSKKPSSSINVDNTHTSSSPASSSLLLNNSFNPTDLHLANFPEQMHFASLHAGLFNPMNAAGFLLENSNNAPFHEFMENKYEALVGTTGSHDFLGESSFNGGFHNGMSLCAPFGSSINLDHHGNLNSSSSVGGSGNILESCQRLMLPFDQNHNLDHNQSNHHELQDVKPNPKILSLEWHDHNNFGGLGSWTGLMNGYGTSATNPLV